MKSVKPPRSGGARRRAARCNQTQAPPWNRSKHTHRRGSPGDPDAHALPTVAAVMPCMLNWFTYKLPLRQKTSSMPTVQFGDIGTRNDEQHPACRDVELWRRRQTQRASRHHRRFRASHDAWERNARRGSAGTKPARVGDANAPPASHGARVVAKLGRVCQSKRSCSLCANLAPSSTLCAPDT